jgi:outer membrane protein assembly factor BamB
LGGPGSSGDSDGSPLPEPGAFHWQYPAEMNGETKDAYVRAPVAVLSDSVLVPLAAGPQPGLVCLPADAPALEPPKARWFYSTRNGIFLSPAAVGQNVLIVDGQPSDASRQLHCIDVATGSPRWHKPIASEVPGAFSVADNCVLVQDAGGKLTCLDLEGTVVWSLPVGKLAHAATATESMVIAAASRPAALVALDRPTGCELWRVGLDAEPTTSPAVSHSTIYLGTAAGMQARSLVDGQPLPGWKREGGIPGDFALGRDSLTFINDNGELVVLSRTDGSVVSRIPGAVRGLAPIVSRDEVLYAAEGTLMRCAINGPTARPEPWLDTSWLGRFTAPMVLKDSNLYAGVAGWGLVRMGKGR